MKLDRLEDPPLTGQPALDPPFPPGYLRCEFARIADYLEGKSAAYRDIPEGRQPDLLWGFIDAVIILARRGRGPGCLAEHERLRAELRHAQADLQLALIAAHVEHAAHEACQAELMDLRARLETQRAATESLGRERDRLEAAAGDVREFLCEIAPFWWDGTLEHWQQVIGSLDLALGDEPTDLLDGSPAASEEPDNAEPSAGDVLDLRLCLDMAPSGLLQCHRERGHAGEHATIDGMSWGGAQQQPAIHPSHRWQRDSQDELHPSFGCTGCGIEAGDPRQAEPCAMTEPAPPPGGPTDA